MNKKGLLLFPLIGGMMLGGCDLGNFDLMKIIDPLNWFHNKDEKDQDDKHEDEHEGEKEKEDEKDEGDKDTPPQEVDKTGLEEFSGYRRVKTPQEGKDYLLGFTNYSNGSVRFATGNFHYDEEKLDDHPFDGTYPFYMGITDGTTTEGAATFKIEPLESNPTKFNIKAYCPGKDWNEKYISIYQAVTKTNRDSFSICAVDNLEEQAEVYAKNADGSYPQDDQGNYIKTKVDVFGDFEYVESYTFNNNIYKFETFGIKVQLLNVDATPAYRLFGSAYQKYVSIDCQHIESATEDSYSVCHFYEKIAE